MVEEETIVDDPLLIEYSADSDDPLLIDYSNDSDDPLLIDYSNDSDDPLLIDYSTDSDDPLLIDYSADSDVKQETKEEVKGAYWIKSNTSFLYCSPFSYRSSNFAIAKLSLLKKNITPSRS